jgi:hypothetical protein
MRVKLLYALPPAMAALLLWWPFRWEKAVASESRVPFCREVAGTLPLCNLGIHPDLSPAGILFTLSCDVAKPQNFADIDYAGESVSYADSSGEYSMVALEGVLCCGPPKKGVYRRSRTWSEHSWFFNVDKTRVEGFDVKGVSKDGTYWRWIGTFGGQVRYEGVSEGAAKYFDGILNSMCIDAIP